MGVDIKNGAPNGIRIHVAGLKGRCPRPLDDGGVIKKYSKENACFTMWFSIRQQVWLVGQ